MDALPPPMAEAPKEEEGGYAKGESLAPVGLGAVGWAGLVVRGQAELVAGAVASVAMLEVLSDMIGSFRLM